METPWFDLRITLGVILNVIVLVVTMVSCYFGIIRRIDRHESRHAALEQKIQMIWSWFKNEHGIQTDGNVQKKSNED